MGTMSEARRDCVEPFDRFCNDVEDLTCLYVVFLGFCVQGSIDNSDE